MSKVFDAKVLAVYMVAPNTYYMEFDAPDIARLAVPGQFVHVRCGETNDPLLRRPISIHMVSRPKGVLALLFRVVGKGTEILSQQKPGDRVNMMGPLGRGFTLPLPGSKVAVAAGGIGAAPLVFLVQELANIKCQVTVYLGARDKRSILCDGQFIQMEAEVVIATDDGSLGFKGTVPELMKRHMDWRKTAMTYVCGPGIMMKEISTMLAEADVPGEVSLEERMGCGVGACLSCAVKISHHGQISNKRACFEGPVFPSWQVVWE
ncbi:dihydroorotate oxidase B, electron transfer subunit [Desulforamulus reducens MI-1]|uniref:Dihydroorotate dehydrogenase B (NAD(+)), electron transfer subunit n=1 Tax=Desulforamulus reducens (strain ATCC BAA-1160 / DSM 100696 / MI-1) TaxID=349161 RepID=PYRK_DESRM|nr:dihydroorotate dehydrogenase electron transfer subunit [Desulforamulus reducens]A4J559.1 RecName: Full=Dihydroorotate dehydrogenase B (NAD(+)), electron transfer subunit; AltName: Full=Dihydroorotate oxidase B, electron transfer subunit [Desulforamulus reducens MI-1]ABO50212.1 dihydroorotate oxidase B, electron transfer subunit [Desulforamulus reducens MI-1]